MKNYCPIPGPAPIERVDVSAFTIPTATPESDGTLPWNSTTLIWVEIHGGGITGAGYGYAPPAVAGFISQALGPVLFGRSPFNIPEIHDLLWWHVRNDGRSGMASMAISCVDAALWDMKAKILNLPLVQLLGACRPAVPLYASGGFTSYDKKMLQDYLSRCAGEGFRMFKIKIGSQPEYDIRRVSDAREAIGPHNSLFVDANEAYELKQALRMAEAFDHYGVTWFEQPIYYNNLAGYKTLKQRLPAGMQLATGEYVDDLNGFRQLLENDTADVVQADASRCGGITSFLAAGALCQASHIPLSSHCCPMLHLHAACAIPGLVHMEYFFDHARIENRLFEDIPQPHNGWLAPDLSRPGLGLTLNEKAAAPYQIYHHTIIKQ